MSWAEFGRDENIRGHERVVNKLEGIWHRQNPNIVTAPGTFGTIQPSESQDGEVLNEKKKAKLVKH